MSAAEPASDSAASRPSPLHGRRVLALEHFIAGPWCTQILAAAGAEVIKIERPGVGDPRRWYDPYAEHDGERVSGGFASYNLSKKSVTLDVTKPGGRQVFLELADTADVIVENIRPGLMDKAGLSYEVLTERNPGLIYCTISGFGRRLSEPGPYSDWPAFDPVIQAMGGLASLVGELGGPPGLAPAGSVDVMSGTWAANAILMALLQRSADGRGQFLDIAMYDVLVSFLGRPLMIQDWVGETLSRGLDTFTPVGLFRCGDGGHVAIIIPTDEMWKRTCAAIEREDMLSDDGLQSNLQRSKAMNSVIVAALEIWAADKTRLVACEQLAASGVPAGMVQTIDEVYACKQLESRGMFVTVDDPIPGPRRYPRLPVLFSEYEPSYARTPRLGEHTEELLDSVGVNEQERVALRQRGVI
jgi:CoA:oxalate CoA-transferase